MERQKIRFASGDTECAAWHYPGTNGGCVVMTGGFAVTKEPGTDLFARRFNRGRVQRPGLRLPPPGRERRATAPGAARRRAARRLAGRDRLRPGAARSRPGQDRDLELFRLGRPRVPRSPPTTRAWPRRSPRRRTPTARRRRATRRGTRSRRHAPLRRPGHRRRRRRPGRPSAQAGARSPGAPGTVAMLTTPDGQDGSRALDPDGRYPDWRQEVAARSALRLSFYRPGRYATRVRCPLLVLVCDQDQSVLAGPAVRAAGRAPRAELVRMPGGHYEPFLGGHERAVEAELSFLRRHLLGESAARPARPRPRSPPGGRHESRSSCPPGRSSTRTPAATDRYSCCCTGGAGGASRAPRAPGYPPGGAGRDLFVRGSGFRGGSGALQGPGSSRRALSSR